MKYAYFPGCSLKGSGKAFEESMLRLFEALGIELEELEDWNCCGATAYMSIDEVTAAALATRNLALAERTGLPLAVPCAGCFGVLRKAEHLQKTYPDIRNRVAQGLSAAGLSYAGTADVRHPLQILAQDLGAKAVRAKVKRPLKGLKVAPYYGCKLVRPEAPFDDPYAPQTMETLLKSVGARVVDFALKTRCCGGSLTGTLPEVGLGLNYDILREAQRREADVIATACPLCQFNLECYQDDMRRQHPELKPMPVVYFTQLIGIALGLGERAMALGRQIVPLEPILRERGILESAAPAKQPAPVGA
jgi:heterodisulfide reductase subunit B